MRVTRREVVPWWKVVARSRPANSITDDAMKELPLTVSKVSPLVAVMLVGEMELMEGAGLPMVSGTEALRLVSAVLVAFTVP